MVLGSLLEILRLLLCPNEMVEVFEEWHHSCLVASAFRLVEGVFSVI